jgi:glycosyltransferase involved in cell wall biosynthesis
MPSLTVLIPCKNERRHLAECIASVRPVADEILVADSGSTDGSLEIAKSLGCRVIERDYVNSANFKNWAIPQARYNWVLVVDADERVTPQLATEIRNAFAKDPQHDAYQLRRDLYFLGHRINHCGVSDGFLVRLFRRDLCRYQKRRVHADVEVPGGKIGRLTHRLLHYTALDIDDFVAKQQRYSTWSALDAYDAGRRSTLAKMLLHAPLRFLQLYFLKRGFLDGRAGLVVCGIMAYYTFLKDAKLWSLRHAQELPPSVVEPSATPRREAA